jgi:hypothetical protein
LGSTSSSISMLSSSASFHARMWLSSPHV